MVESAAAVSPDDYRRWRETTLGRITETLEADLLRDLTGPLDGCRLLEVGCGDGIHLVAAARRGAVVTGVDRSAAMLAAARRRADAHHVSVALCRADAEALPFPDAVFDVVLAVTVLCLVSDAPAAVRGMARLLRPGGRLVIGELGRWNTWAAWRRIRGRLGSSTWRHVTFSSPRRLVDLTRRAGLVPERVHGTVHYPPVAALARMLAPLERLPPTRTTVGAAFVAVAATRPGS